MHGPIIQFSNRDLGTEMLAVRSGADDVQVEGQRVKEDINSDGRYDDFKQAGDRWRGMTADRYPPPPPPFPDRPRIVFPFPCHMSCADLNLNMSQSIHGGAMLHSASPFLPNLLYRPRPKNVIIVSWRHNVAFVSTRYCQCFCLRSTFQSASCMLEPRATPQNE